jgi:dual specificity tyrosine-phosphorylation-regulated kinase 2/3/4
MNLQEFEERESKSYDKIYFSGKTDKQIKINQDDINNGFDTEDRYIINKGDHIAYRYEIIAKIGKGVFSDVIKVLDHKDRSERVIKIIKNEYRFSKQHQKELKILYLIKENFPSNDILLDIIGNFNFRHHDCVIMNMFYMNLYEYYKSKGYLDQQTTINFTKQILNGLEYLEKIKVIHADLKPENIMIKDAKCDKVIIIDLGSSFFFHQNKNFYIQSRYYRSPEAVLGYKYYDNNIDLWSLGCIVYEIFTGIVLFPGKNENHLMCYFIDILSQEPEKQFLEKCKNIKKYLKKNYNTSDRRIYSISDNMLTFDYAIQVFFEKLLIWEPYKRITIQESIQLFESI